MRRFEATTPLGELVASCRADLLAAAELRHLCDVRVFGSLARGDDCAGSDVDLLVKFGPEARPLDLLSLACDAEEILGVRVDVSTWDGLRPEVRAGVAADLIPL